MSNYNNKNGGMFSSTAARNFARRTANIVRKVGEGIIESKTQDTVKDELKKLEKGHYSKKKSPTGTRKKSPNKSRKSPARTRKNSPDSEFIFGPLTKESANKKNNKDDKAYKPPSTYYANKGTIQPRTNLSRQAKKDVNYNEDLTRVLQSGQLLSFIPASLYGISENNTKKGGRPTRRYKKTNKLMKTHKKRKIRKYKKT